MAWIRKHAAALGAALVAAFLLFATWVARKNRIAEAKRKAAKADAEIESLKLRRAKLEASNRIDAEEDAKIEGQIKNLRAISGVYQREVMRMTDEELDREHDRLGL